MTDGKTRKVPRFGTDAWLLRGIHSLPGTLQLARGRLSFTAFDTGNLRRRQLRALEHEFGRQGLTATLEQGRTVVLFDLSPSEVQEVCFPWYYFSGGLTLTVNDICYRFGFDQPSNTKGAGEGGNLIRSISTARKRGKMWKTLLTGLCRSPSPV
jgi:hypothetical protein